MRENLQDKIRTLVYDAIDDISEELGIECNKYPEVYYVHKNFSFNRLGISKKEEADFNFIRRDGNAIYLLEPNIILLANRNTADIYEEVGHFLHFNYSNLKFTGKSREEKLFMSTLVEAIGYFCSKLGDSSRRPLFEDYPDFHKDGEKCLKIIKAESLNPNSFFIYQQGYGMGEKLFNHYISGLTSKEKIVELMSKKFEGYYEATSAFLQLRDFFDKYYIDKPQLK